MKGFLLLSVIVGIFMLMISKCAGCDDSSTSGSETSTTGTTSSDPTSLNVQVLSSTLQLIITNNDSFDYKDVEIEINGDYKYTTSSIPAGQTLTVGFLQFSDSDNNRFDPIAKKASSISIWCVLDSGSKGFSYVTLN